jgi:hypothetical protein
MERVRCARAVCRGIGQGIDNLQLLDDRAVKMVPRARNSIVQSIAKRPSLLCLASTR